MKKYLTVHVKGRCGVVRKFSIFIQRMQWFNSEQMSDMLSKLIPAPVSRRHKTVCMICEEIPKDSWHLYVCLAQTVISVVVAMKGSFSWKHIAEGGVSNDDESSVGYITGRNRRKAGLWSTHMSRRVCVDISLSFLSGYVYMGRQ